MAIIKYEFAGEEKTGVVMSTTKENLFGNETAVLADISEPTTLVVVKKNPFHGMWETVCRCLNGDEMSLYALEAMYC